MRYCSLLLVVLLAGCSRSDADKPIELGHVNPPNQEDEFQALDLAVDELNKDAANRPLGRPVRMIHAPGGARPEEWGAQAARLVALNKVRGLIGGDRSDQAERIGAAVQGEEVIVLSPADWPGAGAKDLITVGIAPSERGRVLAKVASERKPQSIAIVRDPAAKSANLAADRFAADCQAAGVRVIDPAPAKAAADVVFLACPAAKAVEAAGQKGSYLFGGDDAELPALLAGGAPAEGIIVATAFDPNLKNERLTAFATRYREKYGRPPSAAAVLAHDAFAVWVEAVRRANSLDVVPIRDQLLKREKPFETLTGPLTFADDHTARRAVFVGRVAEGRLREVKPVEAEREAGVR